MSDGYEPVGPRREGAGMSGGYGPAGPGGLDDGDEVTLLSPRRRPGGSGSGDRPDDTDATVMRGKAAETAEGLVDDDDATRLGRGLVGDDDETRFPPNRTVRSRPVDDPDRTVLAREIDSTAISTRPRPGATGLFGPDPPSPLGRVAYVPGAEAMPQQVYGIRGEPVLPAVVRQGYGSDQTVFRPVAAPVPARRGGSRARVLLVVVAVLAVILAAVAGIVVLVLGE